MQNIADLVTSLEVEGEPGEGQGRSSVAQGKEMGRRRLSEHMDPERIG